MEQGSSYQFKLVVTDSVGAFDQATINVTVGREPWGGYIDITPSNGTALIQHFFIVTANWTDDPESLPLKYAFEYQLEDGDTTSVTKLTLQQNITTVLPLGYSDDNAHPVVARVQDIFGDESQANMTVNTPPPSLDVTVEVVANQSTKIESLLEAGDDDAIQDAVVTCTAGASLLVSALDITICTLMVEICLNICPAPTDLCNDLR